MNRILLLSLALAWSTLCANAQLGIEIPAKLTDRPELIIKHCGYTLSYNKDRGTPNWSAWMLTKSQVQNSTTERTNDFQPDPSVPIKFRIQPTDYVGSGYDRGHLYPAADASWSTTSMHDSFYMSNICPQVPALNRASWKTLETKCRSWVFTEDTIYIVAGPVYRLLSLSKYKSIGKTHKVDVPDGFFKVILSLKHGHENAIGFYYSNISRKQSISASATTVEYIETLTGIDFFCSLNDSVEGRLERQYDLRNWQ